MDTSPSPRFYSLNRLGLVGLILTAVGAFCFISSFAGVVNESSLSWLAVGIPALIVGPVFLGLHWAVKIVIAHLHAA